MSAAELEDSAAWRNAVWRRAVVGPGVEEADAVPGLADFDGKAGWAGTGWRLDGVGGDALGLGEGNGAWR